MSDFFPVHWLSVLVICGALWAIWSVLRRMKEPVRSLRWYFGIFGSLGVVGDILLSRFEPSVPDTWALLTRVYYFGISCAALYAAFALPRLLRTRLSVMVAVVEVARVVTVITFLVNISANKTAGPFFALAFGLWLQGYLKKNLKRLAAECAPSTGPVASCPECGTAVGAWRAE